MKLAIYSITKTLFEGQTEKLVCKTPQGEITVLDNHIPLITPLIGPAAEIESRGGEKTVIPFPSGILEVRPESEVVILADTG